MYYVWYSLLFTLCFVGLLANLIALPGNWAMLLFAAVFAWLVPESRLSWIAVGLSLALAVAGEIVESVAGAAGAAKLGAKRRSMVLSLIATVVGSIVGSFVVPIPVVGTVIGAVGGGALGAYAGAYVGELSAGTESKLGHKIGGAAMKGRLLGTAAKLLIGLAMFVLIAVDAF